MGAPLGNDNATRGLPWRRALDRALAQDDGKRLRAAAEKLLDEAANGEAWAIKELADRLDGKAAQAVIVAGDQDNPLASKITVEIVRAAAAGTDPGSS